MDNKPLDRGAWRFCVAPMLDWTDRWCREFHRMLTRRSRLYSEMVATQTLVHGDRERHLAMGRDPGPTALQLGGNDPRELAQCAKWGEAAGYCEINLNCGCPSPRVQSGAFGAVLMRDPALVADSFKAMADAVSVPVTVKHRTGVDRETSYGFVRDFVGTLAEAGARVFIVHSRAAWLRGLSPKENRDVPPLDRDAVRRLREDFPECVFVLNGAIGSIGEAGELLRGFEGVMVGRAAYNDPWMLSRVDHELFGAPAFGASRDEVVRRAASFLGEVQRTEPLAARTAANHLAGLAKGLPGARAWRRELTSHIAWKKYGAEEIVLRAWEAVSGGMNNGVEDV